MLVCLYSLFVFFCIIAAQTIAFLKMSTNFWRMMGAQGDPRRAAVPDGAISLPPSDMIRYKAGPEHMRVSGPSSRSAVPRAASKPVSGRRKVGHPSERFESPVNGGMPYADQYYVYTPYISLKSTPVPLSTEPRLRGKHMGGHPAYPSLSYNIQPGSTTRDSDVELNQPYWYRHNQGPSYDQMWEYNMVLQQQYLQNMAKARRMRHLQ